MEKLPIKHVPGHELTCLPGEATRTIDQGESGEATDKKGTQLHSSGADVLELQVHKLCGRSSLEAQGLGNKGMQILQAECVHLKATEKVCIRSQERSKASVVDLSH